MDVEKATVIDVDADVEGKLSGKDARVLGRFRGEVELQGRLYVGESARMDARVKADAAEIAGEFKGDLVVRSLLLLEKARVTGSIDAQTLGVREGAQINGSVNAGGAVRAQAPAASAPPPPRPASGTAAG
jgi:cytoskeletal protein CcmA (bactofilin family)